MLKKKKKKKKKKEKKKEKETKQEIVLGFIAMIKNEIGGLFVHPKKHGQGIGKNLIKKASEEGGEKRIEVEVFKKNEIGLPFYYHFGFVFLREYYHEESGQEMLRLVWEREE